MPKTTSSNKLILGIDTATPDTVVALSNGMVSSWHSNRNQTVELLPKIDRLLAKAKIDPSELGGVMVALGPGTFSGLRVGITTANGFGYGLNIGVHGVDHFQLLHFLYPKSDLFVLAAGKDEVFTKRDKTPPVVTKIERLSSVVKKGDIVCVDTYELIPRIHEHLARAGTIYLVSLSRKERMETMLTMANIPKKFSQVLPVYVREASTTKPRKKAR